MKNLCRLTVILLVIFSGCKKTPPKVTPPIAVYTIGSGGMCTGTIVSGRFVADTALTSANTVSITVDVSVAGPFWVTTNTANGISFSQISTFTSTGAQTVVLTGTGTPVTTDTTNFTVTALTGLGGSCSFSVATVQGVPPHYYLTCLLNGVYANFSDSAAASNSNIPGISATTGLDVHGLDTIINSNSKIELGVVNPGTVGTGTYTDTSSSKSYLSYLDNLGQTWTADSLTSQSSLTIVVTNVSANNVQGTFSGIIKNQLGTGTDSIAVTNGLFSVPVQ